MTAIYALPAGFTPPRWDIKQTMGENRNAEQLFLDELKAFLVKRNPKQQHVGATISFPVADGYALYMVASLTPAELIHIPLGDAWEYQYIHRLTKKDIVDKITSAQRLDNLFKKKS